MATARRKFARWSVLRRHWVDVDGMPFIRRLIIVQTPSFAVFLSKIYEADTRPDPHDHSRWFASWILSGGYTELIWDGSIHTEPRERHHTRWSWHCMAPSQAHAITFVMKPLWTLIITGKHQSTWHFWTPEGKIDWREYDDVDEREGDAG